MNNNFINDTRAEMISDYIVKRAGFDTLANNILQAGLMVPAFSFAIPMIGGYGYHLLNREANKNALIAERRRKALDDKIKGLYNEGL